MYRTLQFVFFIIFAVAPSFLRASSSPLQEEPNYNRVYQDGNNNEQQIQLVLGQSFALAQVHDLVASIKTQLADPNKQHIEVTLAQHFSREEATKLLSQLRIQLR